VSIYDFEPPKVPASHCWSCLLGQHPGGAHPWASDEEDEKTIADLNQDLKIMGLPPLTEQQRACKCGCTKDSSYADQGPPDMDQESLTSTPCTVCGAHGACGYDAEGRALIHAADTEAEEGAEQ
jgi:hypothetical protein